MNKQSIIGTVFFAFFALAFIGVMLFSISTLIKKERDFLDLKKEMNIAKNEMSCFDKIKTSGDIDTLFFENMKNITTENVTKDDFIAILQKINENTGMKIKNFKCELSEQYDFFCKVNADGNDEAQEKFLSNYNMMTGKLIGITDYISNDSSISFSFFIKKHKNDFNKNFCKSFDTKIINKIGKNIFK